MVNDIVKIRKVLNTKKAERDLISKQIKANETMMSSMVNRLEKLEEARKIIQQVAVDTENNLVFHIDSIVSMALSSVFGPELSFSCSFEQERNKTVCYLQFKDQEGNLCKPVDSDGCGALDVASFALRAAFWSLSPTRSTLILDEPFSSLDRGTVHLAAEMIETISNKLELQIIMITHIPEFKAIADRIFQVVKKGNISTIIVEDKGRYNGQTTTTPSKGIKDGNSI